MKRAEVLLRADEEELRNVLSLLPDNPIPWQAIVRLIAPLVARLAVRYAIRRTKRGVSEAKVKSISDAIAALVRQAVGTGGADVRQDGAS